MKRQFIPILLLAICGGSIAQTFHIEEDPAYKPLPVAIQKAVQSFSEGAWDKEVFENCALVGAPIDILSNGQMNGYIVSTNGCGGGSAAMPVWLVASTNAMHRVVLSYGAVALTLRSQTTNGLRNVIATQANAGHCASIELHFNGKRYIEAKRTACKS